MLNLYQYHDKPQALVKYEQARTQVPQMAWKLARTLEQKRASEHLWAQDPKLAYTYADKVLKAPWPWGSEAEKTIARDAMYACLYALDVLKAPWPPGSEAEKTIARDTRLAYAYARYVLKLDDEYAKTWGQDFRNKRQKQKKQQQGPQPND